MTGTISFVFAECTHLEKIDNMEQLNEDYVVMGSTNEINAVHAMQTKDDASSYWSPIDADNEQLWNLTVIKTDMEINAIEFSVANVESFSVAVEKRDTEDLRLSVTNVSKINTNTF